MSIFISHSSKDKKLIDQFVEKILILGCGLSERDIFCTSIEGLGIRNGLDFREHIKSKLKEADYSFIMISKNYKESEVCLNEMGASWALEGLEIKQYLFPGQDFSSLGLLLNVKQASLLSDSSALDELLDELSERYNTKRKTTVRWNKIKKSFLDDVTAYESESGNHIVPSAEEFFDSFIKGNVSVRHVLLKAQPTLLDCRTVFTSKLCKWFYEIYFELFEHLEKGRDPLPPRK